jgi:hypothetical protein
MQTPAWLTIVETLTFVCLLIGIAYNRMVSWKKFNDRTTKLEIAFSQYQQDIQHYLEVCEICRTEVRQHHDGRTATHVTPELRDQINALVRDVADIKRFLMEHPA